MEEAEANFVTSHLNLLPCDIRMFNRTTVFIDDVTCDVAWWQLVCELHVLGCRCESDGIAELESHLSTLLHDILQPTDDHHATLMLMVFYVVRHTL